MRNAPAMHGNDHRPGGPDPIPGGTGVATGAFRVYAADVDIDSGVHTLAVLEFLEFDVSGWFDDTTYTYTAGLDGFYRFSIMLAVGESAGVGGDDGRITDRNFFAATLMVNPSGAEVDYAFMAHTVMSQDVAGARVYGSQTFTGTVDVPLVAGDECQVDLFQTNPGDVWKLEMQVLQFTGHYIGTIA